ncbi:unnamed protein product [Heterobilharzia americana]|nr:unnamed protein product [Heterobilharzia americana]
MAQEIIRFIIQSSDKILELFGAQPSSPLSRMPSARVSMMIMNSGAHFPGLRSLRQVPHGSVIFHNNPHLCYLSSLPWVNSAHKSILTTLNQTSSIQITIIDGPSEKYCESLNHVCHAACHKEYGCWGPGPDQCVRCSYRRAGLHTCVQSCSDLPGFMSEQWETTFLMKKKHLDNNTAKHFDLNYYTADSEDNCIPCHPECGKSCTGPGANECLGSCKTAWSEDQCVSECRQNTYLNINRRICEPCQTHCHQRKITKQPVCSGPGRHPGKGGCNKCEKFIIQSPFNQPNSELTVKLDSTSLTNAVSLLCIRGDCPPGTYLTTEMVQPNSLFAKYAETYTSVAAVCRPCHPRCPMCTAHSLLRANDQRLGCLKCNGFWLRDTCVEHCPTEQTYSLLVNNNASFAEGNFQKNTNSDEVSSKMNGVHVRHVNGQCLACHEQCHAGCWGPGPDQCNHCLNVKVPVRFLSENLTNIDGLQRLNEENPSTDLRNLNFHLYHGKFICSPKCPDELYYRITNVPEMDGETICHHSAYLSKSDKTFAVITGIRKSSSSFSSVNGNTMHRRLKNDPIIIIMIPSCIILLIFAMLILMCYRYRSNQQYIEKHEHNPLILLKMIFCPLSFISKRFGTNAATYQYKKGSLVINLSSINHPQSNNFDENGVNMNQIQNLNPEESLLRRSSLTGSHRYPNQIVNGQKAPNLGRLIMINLDDLCLNEKSGPLGTGAFGAVYQGVWKVRQTDYPNLPNLNHVIEAANEEELLLKANSQNNCASLMNPTPTDKMKILSTDQMKPNSVLESGTNVSTAGQSTFSTSKNDSIGEPNSCSTGSSITTTKVVPERSNKDYRLLCVAVKILNEVRGSSDLQALLDEAKINLCVQITTFSTSR